MNKYEILHLVAILAPLATAAIKLWTAKIKAARKPLEISSVAQITYRIQAD